MVTDKVRREFELRDASQSMAFVFRIMVVISSSAKFGLSRPIAEAPDWSPGDAGVVIEPTAAITANHSCSRREEELVSHSQSYSRVCVEDLGDFAFSTSKDSGSHTSSFLLEPRVE
ncbi:hypothetical protein BDW71DRAFT_107115 [Aspergillus fruticulosus]